MKKRFLGKGIPGVNLDQLKGTLVVIEGADGSGRSTQIALLKQWLERKGYPTSETGMKRSTLVGEELNEAMQGNTLGPTTFSLFYATDFADRMETQVIPALRAGFIVLADRYVYTAIVRDVVRGVDPRWVREVYSLALVPDLVVYLKTSARHLADRSFQKAGVLDYWESGMDIQRSGDMYQCFMRYQGWIRKEFDLLTKEFGFEVVNGDPDPMTVHEEVKERVKKVLRPRITVESADEVVSTRVGLAQRVGALE